LGKNIKALEIQGSFDDCQRMVKQAFADDDINRQLFLTSANSINVARWLPQQFYYFFAYRQWADKNHPPVIAVPSGNFGNICAGILAMQSGLPVHHFIAACNANDIVSGYLETGVLQPREAVPTLSNAMDVGNPSNFIRILEIFAHNFPAVKDKLSAAAVSDMETIKTIGDVYAQFGYLADPHGAVGYLALQRYLDSHPGQKGFFLETAHPVKFPGAVESATGIQVEIPASLSAIMQQEKNAQLMEPSFQQLKDYLLSK
jgi:threonine synthase